MIGQFIKKLEKTPKAATFIQFIRFGIVGVSNTAISYGTEMLCYYVLFRQSRFDGLCALLRALHITLSPETVKIIVISALAFFVSVTNSYYWNSKHVFASDGRKTLSAHLKTYFKTVACYALTGLLLAPWAKTFLVNLGVPFWMSTLLVLVFTIPLNFIMNKLWAFRPMKRTGSNY